jgi:hypothetical protein
MPDSSATLVISLRPDTAEAHRRRVAAWCAELARARGMTPAQELILEQAARTHQPPARGLGWPPESRVSSRHRSRNCNCGAPGRAADPGILALAEALENHFAWEPFAAQAAKVEPSAEKALDSLVSVERAAVERTIADLPVLPAAAQRALGLLAREDRSARDLQSIATSDPVVAAELIRAANSAAFGARQEIKTLAQAVAHIGTEKACRILVAASLKRLFVVKTLHGVWNHSLEASQIAQSVAKLSPRVNPEEALLAGLVHDIGRLAAPLLPEEFQRRSARLLA